MKTIIVTGGAGFIGSNLVHRAMARTDARVVVIDKLTYAGSLENLAGLAEGPRYAFVRADVADAAAMREVYARHDPDAVVHLAAETHVDRTIDDPSASLSTNVVGAYTLLEAARKHIATLAPERAAAFRFVQVSTDEVYGSLGPQGAFREDTPYAPNSPYSATKAAADHLARAWFRTYGVPAIITNCSNNYGPRQYPEKLIPLMVLNALEGKALPIYGDGLNVRDWLHVDDHCDALLAVVERGRPGEKYNVGGGEELTNIAVVDALCEALARIVPPASNPALVARGLPDYKALKTFVTDRPGHDRRYAIDASKIHAELGWSPAHDFARGIEETARWYIEHRDWCRAVQSGRYGRERLGLSQAPAPKDTP